MQAILYRIRYLKPFSVLDMTLDCIRCWGTSHGVQGMCNTLSLPLLPVPLWSQVVFVRIPSMGLTGLFSHLLRIVISYMKAIQLCTKHIRWEYLIDRITWNHLVLVCLYPTNSFENEVTFKLFTLRHTHAHRGFGIE